MEENIVKFEEKLKELVALGKKKKSVLEIQEINDFFSDMELSPEQMEQVFEYLEAKGIDVLRINSDTDDDDDMEVILSDEDEEMCIRDRHRGGRVSKTAAVLGTMVKVKPIIHMDDNGALQVIGKERGRKKSLHKIVDMAVERSKGWDNEIIMITHGDCLEDAEYVAKLVREKMGVENVFIHNIGTVIGSHTGPGVVATFCMGNKR